MLGIRRDKISTNTLIDARVLEMIDNGLIQEVTSLLAE